MNVLILGSAGGDAHRRTLHAIVANAAARHEVRVLAPDAEGKLLRPLGVPVESWKPAGLFNVLRSIGALRRTVERFAPDAIHAVGWTAAVVALGALTPADAEKTVVTLLDPIHEGEIPKQFIDKRLPELMGRAFATTCAYRSLATELTERFGVDPARVEVIAPGVTPQPTPDPAAPQGAKDGPLAGYVARLDDDFAWQSVIDAVAMVQTRLPQARLRFGVGDALRARVRTYVRSRRIRAEVSAAEPPAGFLTGVDLAIVPAGRDGLPYALPQALVDGLPVIATNLGGLADTLGPFDTGWLVPYGPEGIAAGIEAAWPRIGAARAGAQAQRAAARAAFDPAAIAARFAVLYDRAAAGLGSSEDAVGSQVDANGFG